MKRSPLRKLGKSKVSTVKRRIQALLRQNAIKRDKRCVLAEFRGIVGECNEILQAEHLLTRERSVGFGNMKNIVLLCQYHHIFWKPKNSRLYWELIEKIISPERWKWLKLAEADRTPQRMNLSDWLLIEKDLQNQLSTPV